MTIGKKYGLLPHTQTAQTTGFNFIICVQTRSHDRDVTTGLLASMCYTKTDVQTCCCFRMDLSILQ